MGGRTNGVSNTQQLSLNLTPTLTTKGRGIGSYSFQFNSNGNSSITLQDCQTIKKYLKFIAPNVDWNSLSKVEKERYIARYTDGSLKQQYEEIKNNLKLELKECKTYDEAMDKMLQVLIERENPGFTSLSKEEQAQAIQNKKLQALYLLVPGAKTASAERQEKLLNNNKQKITDFLLANYLGFLQFDKRSAYMVNTISFKSILDTFHQELLAGIEDTPKVANTKMRTRSGNQNEIKNIRRELVKEAHDKGIPYTSEDELFINYCNDLINRGVKLSDSVRAEYEALLEKQRIQGGVLYGCSVSSSIDAESSFVNTSGLVDENTKLEEFTEKQKQEIKEYFETCFNKLETEEEKIEFLREATLRAGSESELELLAEIITKANISSELIYKAFQVKKEGNSEDSQPIIDITVDDLNELGITEDSEVNQNLEQFREDELSYDNVEQFIAIFSTIAGKSYNMTEENEQQFMTETMKRAVDEGLMKEETYSGIEKHIVPKADEENVETVTNYVAETGYATNAMGQILNDIEKNYGLALVQKVTNTITNNENISEETKAIIFKDAIDFAQNSDFKNYLQELANQYGINYNNVASHDERVASKSTSTTNSNGENIASSNFSTNELSTILSRNNGSQDIFGNAINGLLESLEITLGKSPEASGSFKEINSINDAISELKAGSKTITEVFKNCSVSVKKDLIKIICKYGKTAITQLINAFGGDTIYNLAKSENEKRIIKKEVERMALSDATQRTALAEIEKIEEKQDAGYKI